MDLTTKARVKDLLKIGTAITTQDALIDRLITQYSAAIERHLDRHLEKKSRAEDYDARSGGRRIWLKGIPVASITDVRNDFDRIFGSGTIIAATDYVSYPDTGETFFHLFVPVAGPLALRVTYTGGFGAATADILTDFPDLALACEKQVAYYFARKGLQGTTSASAQGGSISLDRRGKEADGSAGDLIPEVLALLEPYRRFAYGLER